MRFIVLTETGTQTLCQDCARAQLSWGILAGAENHGHAWDLSDQPALIVVDRASEMPCAMCQRGMVTRLETPEHLLLHIYTLIKFLGAFRELTAYGGTLVDTVIDLIGRRFPEETEAIRAEIRRLAD